MNPQAHNPDRRQHLIKTASELIYHSGFLNTTLADIAAKSEIPLGSIYYYFRSREDIVRAVMEQRVTALNSFLDKQALEKNPRARLDALVGSGSMTGRLIPSSDARSEACATNWPKGVGR